MMRLDLMLPNHFHRNKMFEMKSLKRIKNKEKINPVKNINKADLKINSYFSSKFFILGTIAITPLGILKPIKEVKRDAEKIRGQADAETTKIFADAFGKDPEFYSFLRYHSYHVLLNQLQVYYY